MQPHGRTRTAQLDPEEAFAKALLRARKQRKIPQELPGFEGGYHRAYISLLERSKMNPSLRTMLSLAAALNIPAAQLVRDVERLRGDPWRRESAQRLPWLSVPGRDRPAGSARDCA